MNDVVDLLDVMFCINQSLWFTSDRENLSSLLHVKPFLAQVVFFPVIVLYLHPIYMQIHSFMDNRFWKDADQISRTIGLWI